MEFEQRVGPHWKSDGSCTYEPDLEGSFRAPVKALNIVWENDIRYWQPVEFTEEEIQSSGFKEGLELLQVKWIEVTGRVPSHLFRTTRFEIFYIVKFKVDAFGWHSAPVKLKMRLSGEELWERSIVLEPYRERHDVWFEIHGGEFKVSSHSSVGSIEFGMFETKSEWWKGGLVLAGVKFKQKPDGVSIL